MKDVYSAAVLPSAMELIIVSKIDLTCQNAFDFAKTLS